MASRWIGNSSEIFPSWSSSSARNWTPFHGIIVSLKRSVRIEVLDINDLTIEELRALYLKDKNHNLEKINNLQKKWKASKKDQRWWSKHLWSKTPTESWTCKIHASRQCQISVSKKSDSVGHANTVQWYWRGSIENRSWTDKRSYYCFWIYKKRNMYQKKNISIIRHYNACLVDFLVCQRNHD